MSRVAIVTDSASDMDPARAASLGIAIVPLVVSFGDETFSAGIDLTRDDFWTRVKTPGSPIATTAACSPGTFQQVYQKAFDDGADSIVSVHVADTLSGTLKAAQVARASMRDREIQIVDSTSASMGEGMLAELGVKLAATGASAAEIAKALEARRPDLQVYLALETLEYLKRGGRISGAQAAIGTLLSVKPIIEIKDGKVETTERVRTRGKARERLVELLTARPIERLSILHTTDADVEAFAEVITKAARLDGSQVTIDLVGPSVGPHLGPGCVGGVALYAAA
ncbi:MAG TPA: DegV family protein [Candidatus Limnocylindrales bacterium]|jgi:DegV family protein with EDD domain|nr:DegV family protein [Candidatus Limnocylindrales bacterium]